MVPGLGASVVVRAIAVVPVVILVLFVGLLWLMGLFCSKERRAYIVGISSQVVRTLSPLLHGNPASELRMPVQRRQS